MLALLAYSTCLAILRLIKPGILVIDEACWSPPEQAELRGMGMA